ncbi:MAG: MarR family winged helix-turn-helix transcriptional regulator [Streptosporangiaceae bacterium]
MTRPVPVVDDAAGERAPAEPNALADRLRVTLIRLGRQLRRQDPPGLHITLYSALAIVAYRGELALGELAEAEHVPSSAATRIADKLEAAGYAIRKPNPRDRRGVNLAITPAGRRMVDERRRQGNAWLADRLMRLDDDQRHALADALDVLDTVLRFDADVQAGPGADAADELAGKESR